MVALVVLVILATQSVAQDQRRTERLSFPNWDVDVTRDLFGVKEIMSQTKGEYVSAPGAQSTEAPPVFFVLCRFNQHKQSYINVGVGIPGTYFDIPDNSCKTGTEEFLELAAVVSQVTAMVKDVKEDRFIHNYRFFYTANPRMCGRLNWKKKTMHEFRAVHDAEWTWLINRDDRVGTFKKTKELAEKQDAQGRSVIGVHEEYRSIKISFNLAGLRDVYNAIFLDCGVHKSHWDLKQDWRRYLFK